MNSDWNRAGIVACVWIAKEIPGGVEISGKMSGKAFYTAQVDGIFKGVLGLSKGHSKTTTLCCFQLPSRQIFDSLFLSGNTHSNMGAVALRQLSEEDDIVWSFTFQHKTFPSWLQLPYMIEHCLCSVWNPDTLSSNQFKISIAVPAWQSVDRDHPIVVRTCGVAHIPHSCEQLFL